MLFSGSVIPSRIIWSLLKSSSGWGELIFSLTVWEERSEVGEGPLEGDPEGS